MLEMPVCEHLVPIKLPCGACKRKGERVGRNMDVDYYLLEAKVNTCFDEQKKIKNEFKSHKKSYLEGFNYLDKKIDDNINDIKNLVIKEIDRFNKILCNIKSIEGKGQESIDLFIRKANDLKKVDAKRDDVINSLCQKISALEHIITNRQKEG